MIYISMFEEKLIASVCITTTEREAQQWEMEMEVAFEFGEGEGNVGGGDDGCDCGRRELRAELLEDLGRHSKQRSKWHDLKILINNKG